MRRSLVVLAVLLAAWEVPGCGEKTNSAEACWDFCSPDVDCHDYLLRFCGYPTTSLYDGLCIDGQLYKCKTRPGSHCCEGSDMTFQNIGTCTAQTEACAADAPAPDSNWRALDGDTESAE